MITKSIAFLGVLILIGSLNLTAIMGSHLALVGIGVILSAIFIVLVDIRKEME